jgi:hypothetical protein
MSVTLKILNARTITPVTLKFLHCIKFSCCPSKSSTFLRWEFACCDQAAMYAAGLIATSRAPLVEYVEAKESD